MAQHESEKRSRLFGPFLAPVEHLRLKKRYLTEPLVTDDVALSLNGANDVQPWPPQFGRHVGCDRI
jgi:hypothetical protein